MNCLYRGTAVHTVPTGGVYKLNSLISDLSLKLLVVLEPISKYSNKLFSGLFLRNTTEGVFSLISALP